MNSKIVDVRIIHVKEVKSLFGSESPDFGDLYEFAYRAKQMQEKKGSSRPFKHDQED